MSLFASKPAGSSLFGSSTTVPNTTSGGLFGSAFAPSAPNLTSQPTHASSIFGQPAPQNVFTSQAQQQAQPGASIFGPRPAQQQQGGGFLGGFGTSQQSQPQQQQSFFGASQAQQQQQQQQQQQPQQLLPPRLTSSVWQPGTGLNALNRTIENQIELIYNKWRADSPQSAFQAYLYNFVGENEAPFYAPRFGEDETKWEQALQKRPGPGYIPVLARGFHDLGERLKRQNDYLLLMRGRLHEINNSLTAMLQSHDLVLSVRAADCKRKHLVLSQRCLALATKAQVLKNRGFGMDAMEEDLKMKLDMLEKSVYDPSLNGRTEEIWARMLAIRERSRVLQLQMERYGQANPRDGDGSGPQIDEAGLKAAKSRLEAYAEQLQHLTKELGLIRKDFEEWENNNQKGKGQWNHR